MLTVVALSGGVDSSVAAWLLSQAGGELLGVSMQLWDARSGGGTASRCCSPADFRDARLLAAQAGFPYVVLDYEGAFAERVVAPFASEYGLGRTPNPCVECNRHLKFGALLDAALGLGAQSLATGHYARVDTDAASGRRRLRRARDAAKDQSYFLYALDQRALERVVFPIGGLRKEEVRRVARGAGLRAADKPESQDLCFLGNGGREAFLARLPAAQTPPAGDVVTAAGQRLGTHRGLALYTVGQRRGLGSLPGGPWYVLRLDAAANRVVVGREVEQYACGLEAGEVHWVAGEPPAAASQVQVRIRHSHDPAEATLEPCGQRSARVRFRVPQRSVAPGQAAVFYDGDIVLGGGRIERADAACLTSPAPAA